MSKNVQWNITVDADIKAEFIEKHGDKFSKRIEQLLVLDLNTPANQMLAALRQNVDNEAELEAVLEIKNLGIFSYFEINSKAYNVSAIDYLDHYHKTGRLNFRSKVTL